MAGAVAAGIAACCRAVAAGETVSGPRLGPGFRICARPGRASTACATPCPNTFSEGVKTASAGAYDIGIDT